MAGQISTKTFYEALLKTNKDTAELKVLLTEIKGDIKAFDHKGMKTDINANTENIKKVTETTNKAIIKSSIASGTIASILTALVLVGLL